MIPVIFDTDARKEFLEAVKFYEKSEPGLGQNFNQSVKIAVKTIRQYPFTYRIIKKPFRTYLLPKFPFNIIYTIEPDHIRIIAVAHNKRKPDYWIKRD